MRKEEGEAFKEQIVKLEAKSVDGWILAAFFFLVASLSRRYG
jgi:hypothetical protein